jgi:hypothetical protein
LKIFLSPEFHIPNSLMDAPVAQGIERQPPELKAAGSNPAGRTINTMAISVLIAIVLWNF